MMATLQKITPHLWFDANAEEAVNFYVSIFENSRILNMSRYGDAGPGPKGSVMAIGFELEGQRFAAINGGPHFKFSEAISFLIWCDTQGEIDRRWNALVAGGAAQPCGWLKDKFGLSWQINYSGVPQMMSDPDPARSARIMKAMMQMTKIDLQKLKDAYDGR
jgi:predicted 3-demethylubiquinone-9 3-methyltransferase (glyoxalase superfamily)